jgi:hypothetical protein
MRVKKSPDFGFENALDTEKMCGYNNAPKCVEDFAFISRSITN